MNVLTTGKQRDTKTATSPYLSNHFSAMVRWCARTPTYLP
jgi:hypothetical protein